MEVSTLEDFKDVEDFGFYCKNKLKNKNEMTRKFRNKIVE